MRERDGGSKEAFLCEGKRACCPFPPQSSATSPLCSQSNPPPPPSFLRRNQLLRHGGFPRSSPSSSPLPAGPFISAPTFWDLLLSSRQEVHEKAGGGGDPARRGGGSQPASLGEREGGGRRGLRRGQPSIPKRSARAPPPPQLSRSPPLLLTAASFLPRLALPAPHFLASQARGWVVEGSCRCRRRRRRRPSKRERPCAVPSRGQKGPESPAALAWAGKSGSRPAGSCILFCIGGSLENLSSRG